MLTLAGDWWGVCGFLNQCIGVRQQILIIHVFWILLPAGLGQHLLVRPQRLLLVEGHQGVERGVHRLLPGDQEAACLQNLHNEVAAATLRSVEATLRAGAWAWAPPSPGQALLHRPLLDPQQPCLPPPGLDMLGTAGPAAPSPHPRRAGL